MKKNAQGICREYLQECLHTEGKTNPESSIQPTSQGPFKKVFAFLSVWVLALGLIYGGSARGQAFIAAVSPNPVCPGELLFIFGGSLPANPRICFDGNELDGINILANNANQIVIQVPDTFTNPNPNTPITLQFKGSGNPCSGTPLSTTVSIAPRPPEICYVSSQLCLNSGSYSPGGCGSVNGQFVGPGVGLTIDSNTGAIDTDDPGTLPGVYTVDYFPATGLCPAVQTFTIQIVDEDDATFAYPDSLYCVWDSNPIPLVNTLGGSFSVVSSSGGGLLTFQNPNTGEVDISSTNFDTYTLRYQTAGLCPDNFDTTFVLAAPESASFSYTQDTICDGEAITLNPTVSGAFGSVSVVPASGLGIDNAGVIDGNTSVAGNYTITYTTPGTITGCPSDTAINFAVVAPDTAAFSYPDNPYCITDMFAVPVVTSGPAGIFTAFNPINNVHIDPVSGFVNIASLGITSPGGVAFQFKTGGLCPDSVTFNVVILDTASYTLDYPTVVCGADTDTVAPVSPPSIPGRFSSSPAGITWLSDSLGTFIPSQATPGNYTVTYSPDTFCAIDTSFVLEVLAPEQGIFAYPDSVYCQGDPDPVPVLSAGSGGGNYFEVNGDTGLVFINDTTGQIDLRACRPDTYFVLYNVPAGCNDTVSPRKVIIQQQPDASFLYFSNRFCITSVDSIVPVVNDTTGTFSTLQGNLTIDPNTGQLLSFISAGPDTIRYSIAGSQGGCSAESFFPVFIDTVNSSTTIEYLQNTFCPKDQDPTPILSNLDPLDSTGTFFSEPSYLQFANRDSGTVDLSLSPPDEYIIEYVIPNACQSGGARDTIVINRSDRPELFYDETSFCRSDSFYQPIILSDTGIFVSADTGIILNQGNGAMDLINSQPGNYFIEFQTLGQCPDTANVNISINADPVTQILASDTFLCENDPVTFQAAGGTQSATISFLLNNTPVTGVQNRQFTVPSLLDSSIVILTITEPAGCAASDTLLVEVTRKPAITFLDYPQTISEEFPVRIDLLSNEIGTLFDWRMVSLGQLNVDSLSGTEGPQTTLNDTMTIEEFFSLERPLDPGRMDFFIYTSVGNCIGDSLQLTININPLNAEVFVPEAITPNGDGFNDVWHIQVRSDLDESRYRLELYNDYGGLVKDMDPLESDWSGDNLPDGVYWWILFRDNAAINKGGLTILTK